MNPNNRRAVIVGLFVFFAIAIIVAGVLTLGGQKKSFVKAVHITAVFRDVSGLAAGNNVWFSGVKIGTIRGVSFDANAHVVVLMSIEEKSKKYIRQNAKAKIGSDGLIGNKIVVLYGGTADAPPIVENSRLTVEEALSNDEMLATLQSNNKNLLAITTDFKNISSKIAAGQGSIGKLLTSDALYNDLQSTMNSLRQTANAAKDIGSNLEGYTGKLNQKGTLASDLVSDTVIFSQLRSTVAQINEVATKSNAIVAQLTQATSQINNPASPVGTLLYDQQAGKDLKGTLKNLESASFKLDEDLEALQHNFLLRGFFRKKAKQEKKAAGK